MADNGCQDYEFEVRGYQIFRKAYVNEIQM